MGWSRLQLLAACSSPYDSRQRRSLLLQSQRGRVSWQDTLKSSVTQSHMCDHIHPIALAIVHCLEASHVSHLHSRGGDYRRVGTPGGGDREGHPRICLPQVEKKQNLKLLMAINFLALIVYQSRSTKCRIQKGRRKDFLLWIKTQPIRRRAVNTMPTEIMRVVAEFFLLKK